MADETKSTAVAEKETPVPSTAAEKSTVENTPRISQAPYAGKRIFHRKRHAAGAPTWWRVTRIVLLALGGVIAAIVLFFLTIFYTPWFPGQRDQYILMTYQTSNPWLCTVFFSQKQIDDAFARNTVISPEGETDTDLVVVNPDDGEVTPGQTDEHGSAVTSKTTRPKSFATSAKYEEEVIYEDTGTRIVQFSGKTKKGKYTARLLQVADPSRVFLGITNKLGDKDNPKAKPGKGQTLVSMCETNNALCGINAGGFVDVGGVGTGGIPTKLTVKDYQITVYDNEKKHDVIGFNEDNVLVLGSFTEEEIRERRIRDAMSWSPFLILNGKKASVSGLSGGYDPRSAIGQRADGTVLLLVVDGSIRRSVDGANMELLMDIMWEYGAVNAANLDGGTSSAMALNGKIINTICNPAIASRGRYLATSWLVSTDAGARQLINTVTTAKASAANPATTSAASTTSKPSSTTNGTTTVRSTASTTAATATEHTTAVQTTADAASAAGEE